MYWLPFLGFGIVGNFHFRFNPRADVHSLYLGRQTFSLSVAAMLDLGVRQARRPERFLDRYGTARVLAWSQKLPGSGSRFVA